MELGSLVLLAAFAAAQAPASAPESRPESQPASPPRGVAWTRDGAAPGYTLIAPLRTTTTHLLDMQGREVHAWPSAHLPANGVRLLDDGSLLRACVREHASIHAGGLGGRFERIAWDGALAWEWEAADEQWSPHHDFDVLQNGNLLVLGWERRTRDEALRAGRDPATVGDDGLWSEVVREVRPLDAHGAALVWEWRAWDHLVHDREVAARPQRIDVNAGVRAPIARTARADDVDQRLLATGYTGEARAPQRRPPAARPDWLHANSVAFVPEHDLVLVSVRGTSEVWILDHATTTAEARGASGGRRGRGGDLVARFGNPSAHGGAHAGAREQRRLFAQHDARVVPPGHPGAGHVLVFNNGEGGTERAWSSADEFAIAFEKLGSADMPIALALEPAWTCTAIDGAPFFSSLLSSAQRLPNGNTLVCCGLEGRVVECTSDGRRVWEYWSPHASPTTAGLAPADVAAPYALFRAERIDPAHPGLNRLPR